MKKPVIGILPQYEVETKRIKIEEFYVKAIQKEGGIPILLPLYQEISDIVALLPEIDGVLYPGGPDVSPFYWGEDSAWECRVIQPARDQLEIELLPYILALKKPILGICRGLQVLNIALGGDIYQDIEHLKSDTTNVGHYQKSRGDVPTHYVNVCKDTLLHNIVKLDKIMVNSYHHQVIRTVAKGLEITGYSNDGYTEAVTMREYPFFLGVQWHPEELYEGDKTSQLIFQTFIQACQK